jgi:beta propeller repeat protein
MLRLKLRGRVRTAPGRRTPTEVLKSIHRPLVLATMSAMITLAVCVSATPAPAVAAGPAAWTLDKITNNAAADEWPDIDATNRVIVWQQTPAGQDSEIWIWNYRQGLGKQITSNATEDAYPKIYGDAVVWQGRDADGDWEIYLYRFSTDFTTKLTNNSYDDTQVQIHGNLVVWICQTSSVMDLDLVYVYDIGTAALRSLPCDNGDISHPQTDGSWVTWQIVSTSDCDHEIQYWDGSSVHQVTNNDYEDFFPEISGHQIVWQGQDDGDSEVFHYADGVTTKLTNNTQDDSEPFVDVSSRGTTVGWRYYDGTDWEVRLASRTPTDSTWKDATLTNNTANDLPTDVAGGGVVWYGGPGNPEIYACLPPGDSPSGEIVNISNSVYEDRYPRLGSNAVVWQGRDAGGDWEIFVATRDAEPPVTRILAPTDGVVLSVSPGVISGEATDDAGVTSVQVSIDGFPWQDATIDSGAGTPLVTWHYDWSLPWEDAGVGHVIYARALDESGNSQTSDDQPVIYVDRVSPVISSFAINGGAAQTDSTTVTLNYTVTDGSPLMRMRFSNDGATWSAWEPYADSKLWTLTGGLGMKTVWCSFEDVHGHVAGEGSVSDTIELVSSSSPGPATFTDVPSGYSYADAINGMRDAHIIDGYQVGTTWEFRPNNAVYRAQFAKMICGVIGFLLSEDDWPDPAVPFTDLGADILPGPDVVNSLYPHEYVANAYLAGITKGQTATTFAPYAGIKRCQLITMTVRAMQNLRPGVLTDPPATYSGTLGDFSIDHTDSMRTAEYTGLLAGLVGFGPSWDPWKVATRGETAQVLHNLLVRIGGTSASSNHPPVVDAGLDKSAAAGSLVELRADFTDVDASDTHTAVASWDTLAVDLIVTEPTASTPGTAVEMVMLSTPGLYVVTFTVTDNNGGVGSDTMLLKVTDG